VNIKPAEMLASAGQAEEMLKVLANRHRLTILCQLIDVREPSEYTAERIQGALPFLLSTFDPATGWTRNPR